MIIIQNSNVIDSVTLLHPHNPSFKHRKKKKKNWADKFFPPKQYSNHMINNVCRNSSEKGGLLCHIWAILFINNYICNGYRNEREIFSYVERRRYCVTRYGDTLAYFIVWRKSNGWDYPAMRLQFYQYTKIRIVFSQNNIMLT